MPAPCTRHYILVVDDNKDSADSLAMVLKAMGYEVRTAYDGQEGVEAAQSFHPQVVLLDLSMPRLDGYQAARRIRQQPGGKDMVLIALSGWCQEDDRRRCEQAGFDRHLAKPVEPEALQSLVENFPGK